MTKLEFVSFVSFVAVFLSAFSFVSSVLWQIKGDWGRGTTRELLGIGWLLVATTIRILLVQKR